MEGPLTDDQLTQLAQVAKAKGHTTDELAQEVLARYFEQEARFVFPPLPYIAVYQVKSIPRAVR